MRPEVEAQLDEGIREARTQVAPATYNAHWHQALAGNPFAEALPLLKSRVEALRSLAVLPHYDPKARAAPREIRAFNAKATPAFLQPLTRHYDLHMAMITNLHMGYADRNPLDPKYAANVNRLADAAAAAAEEPAARLDWSGPASALLLIGNSGMGKTTSIRHILSSIPQAVAHSSYAGQSLTRFQLIHLYVETPSDASTKGLASEVFGAIDTALGTDLRNFYLRKQGAARDDAGDMTGILGHLGLGLLVIDEIQNLNVAHSGGPIRTLNFLTYLTNQLNVPIILVGTPEAESFIFKKFRLIRRTTGQGVTEWHNLTGDEFRLFLESLWTYQYTAVETPLTKEHADAMYQESQGNIDVAIKIYRLAQQIAIERGDKKGQEDERITPSLIRSAARKNLGALSTPLIYLRERNLERIGRYGDLSLNRLSPTEAPPAVDKKEPTPSAATAGGTPGPPQQAEGTLTLPPEREGTESLPGTNTLLDLSRLPEEKRSSNYKQLQERGLILPIADWLEESVS